jgi:hypothetical protein
MAVWMRRAPQLHKCLHKMRCAGGRAALAAVRIEAMMTALASHAGLQPQQIHNMTRHGDARIDNCKKFDLVI